MPDSADLTAFALNCSLRGSGSEEPSSTDRMIADLLAELRPHGVEGSVARAVDHDLVPGVLSDMGPGDGWPALRRRVLDADIFILGTPIWLGNPSSVARRVLERMDGFLSEADDRNRMPPAGKVALVAVVGNEDGAHACHAACFQALNDVGFTIPANAGVYWVGEAMQPRNYVDLAEPPEALRSTLKTASAHAVHAARLLKRDRYAGVPSVS
ncbi:flavodoxin family protein [Roseivivax isoporae]|uniref:Multimeric flavodoxin WrbA n=1 Tax=Roseivivax isoporae LMG 25204 TaxID=1449351 RepID=X7F8C4_9RHOB|nr:NAD(P)H-dependent oxidoreductase [Roseivivax isoporae]ETX28978.1 multimeric flavodoxin WrbA [Roseivivax isoporae LMG 25204]